MINSHNQHKLVNKKGHQFRFLTLILTFTHDKIFYLIKIIVMLF